MSSSSILSLVLFGIAAIGIIIFFLGQTDKKRENITSIWESAGFTTQTTKTKVFGIANKNVVGVRVQNNYVFVGMNWVVSTGNSTINYWGIGIFLHSEHPKFSIIKRRPVWLFDSGRIKNDDYELDRITISKCKDEDWFKMTFPYSTFIQIGNVMPKGTTILQVTKPPINLDEISELTGFIKKPYTIVQRKEVIGKSRFLSEVVTTAELVGKALGR